MEATAISVRGASILTTIFAVVFSQHHPYSNYYYQPVNEEYEYSYYDIPKAQFSTSTSSKSSNYLDHYNRDYFYAHHNLTGYPQFGQYANDVEYDYDDYNNNNYEYIEEPSSNNADNLVAPHPVMVALQKWINGIQTRQDINGFLVQLFPGNTIYLVFSVVLGIIGVGGLVFQWAQSIIDRWYKDIEDLQTRVTSLESRSTTVSVPQSVLTSISTLQTDLTSLTTKHANTCARVSDITMAAYAGTQGDLAVTAMNVADYATLLNAVVDPTC